MDTITNLNDERLIRDGEQAVVKYLDCRTKARANVMPMALGLLAARRAHPADQDFGYWLEGSEYAHLGHQDRAALIKIGEHAGVMEKLVRATNLLSPRTIWAEYCEIAEAAVYHHGKPAPAIRLPSESGQEPPVEAAQQESAEPESTFSGDLDPKPRGGSYDVPAKMKLPAYLGVPAEDVARLSAAYPTNRQKQLRARLAELPKAAALRMFNMALEVVDSGRNVDIGNTASVDPRMFWPNLTEGFCRIPLSAMSLAQWDKARGKLAEIDAKTAELRAAGAGAAEIHDTAHALWSGQPLPLKRVATKQDVLPPPESKIKHKVTFCDAVIWPRSNYPDVTEDDVIEGWNFASLWIRRLSVGIAAQKPREIAVMLRHLSNDLAGASSMPGFVTVLRECIAAYDRVDGSEDAMLRNVTPGRPPKHEGSR